MKGYKTNIEKDTLDNNNFRKVLYTSKHVQLGTYESLDPTKKLEKKFTTKMINSFVLKVVMENALSMIVNTK